MAGEEEVEVADAAEENPDLDQPLPKRRRKANRNVYPK